MSKTAKGLLIAALCVLTTWMGIACLYTYSVSEELTTLRRESRSDTVYLRCRIRDLESELAAERAKEQTPPAEAVGGNPAQPQVSRTLSVRTERENFIFLSVDIHRPERFHVFGGIRKSFDL